MKKRAAAILVALCLILLTACTAQEGNGERLRFRDVPGGVALYRYRGGSRLSAFTVPDEHNGKKVVEIQDFAIANNEYLRTLVIGKHIETIGEWGIVNCTNLQTILVDEDNAHFATADGLLYTKDRTEVVACANGRTPIEKDKDGNITRGITVSLPPTVKVVRNNAFYLCGNLWTVTFNEGLESIGNKAFMKCENLQNVRFPATLKTIGIDAFSYCDAFTQVTIPPGVETVGDYAFFSLSSNIKTIRIERENADGLTLGKDWVPNLRNTVGQKSEVVFVG